MRITKVRIGMLTVIGSLAAATIAPAADLVPPYKAPLPAVVVNDWSGFYIGAHGGWGWGNDPFTEVFPPGVQARVPGVTVSDVKSNGFVAGFHAGFNQQWSNWVGGLEIDLSGTGIKGSTSNSATNTIGLSTATQSVSVDDKFELLGSARARLGFLATPNLLLYGTGGLGWTRFNQTTTDTRISTDLLEQGHSVYSTPSWRFGWVAGVGGEAKVFDSSNWLVRLEYLHYDFGNSGSHSETVVDGGSYDPVNFTSGHLTVDVVRAGLSYKFGGHM